MGKNRGLLRSLRIEKPTTSRFESKKLCGKQCKYVINQNNGLFLLERGISFGL